MNTELTLRITSYNCQGFKPRSYDYLREIYQKTSILLLQEHWLHDFDTSIITTVLPGSACHALSSMNSAELRRGRGYGGTAVVWHTSLNAKVTPVTTASSRLCAVLVESEDVRLLVMSVYMPVDEYINNVQYNEVLADIASLHRQSDDFDTCIGGDFNTDVVRGNDRSLRLLEWSEELGLASPALQPDAPRRVTRYAPDGTHALLDYVFVSEGLYQLMEDWNVIDEGNNLSDHCPTFACFRMQVKYNSERGMSQQTNVHQWYRANNDDLINYKQELDRNLQNIDFNSDLFNCNHFICNNNDHHRDINKLFDDIAHALQRSTAAAIPSRRSRGGRGPVPGWNEAVREARDRSLF